MSGWKTFKLKDFADITRGGSPRPIDEYITNGDGYNWLRIGDVPKDGKFITKVSAKIKPEGLSKTTLVHDGDFILSNSMSFGRPYIMKIDTCIHDGWLALRNLRKEMIDRNFLYYLLLTPQTQYKFSSLSAGSGVQNLKKETVKEIEVTIPSVSDQKRIVAILETWDECIEKLDAKIDIKKNIKTGLMQQLITGNGRIPNAIHEWRQIKLGDVGITYGGLSGKAKEDFGDGEPFITYMNVYSNPAINENDFSLVRIGKNEAQNKVRYGDILFTTSSETPDEVGVASVYLGKKDEPYLNSFCFGYRLTDFTKLSPRFARHYFRGQQFRKAMARLAQGASRYNLSKKYFLETSIYIPKDIREQEYLAELLDQINEDIKLLTLKRGLVQSQKRHLANNLVSGNLPIPNSIAVENQELKYA